MSEGSFSFRGSFVYATAAESTKQEYIASVALCRYVVAVSKRSFRRIGHSRRQVSCNANGSRRTRVYVESHWRRWKLSGSHWSYEYDHAEFVDSKMHWKDSLLNMGILGWGRLAIDDVFRVIGKLFQITLFWLAYASLFTRTLRAPMLLRPACLWSWVVLWTSNCMCCFTYCKVMHREEVSCNYQRSFNGLSSLTYAVPCWRKMYVGSTVHVSFDLLEGNRRMYVWYTCALSSCRLTFQTTKKFSTFSSAKQFMSIREYLRHWHLPFFVLMRRSLFILVVCFTGGWVLQTGICVWVHCD